MTRHCLTFAMNLGGSAQHAPAIGISIGAITATARQLRAQAVPAILMWRWQTLTRRRKRTWLQSLRHLAETGRPFTASSVQSCTVQDSLQEGMSRIDDNPLAQVLCRE